MSRRHDVVASRMLVGTVRQRPAQCPLVTALSQHWQMFTDLQSRSPCRDRFELTTYVLWRTGLHVKAFMLRQTTRQKDENARFGQIFSRAMVEAYPEGSR